MSNKIMFGEATEMEIEAPGKWEAAIREFLTLTDAEGNPVKLKVVLADIPTKTKMTGLQYALRKAKLAGEPFPVRVAQRRGKVYLIRIPEEELNE